MVRIHLGASITPTALSESWEPFLVCVLKPVLKPVLKLVLKIRANQRQQVRFQRGEPASNCGSRE